MNARILSCGTALSLVLLAGAGTGCDGSTPRIKSFQADSSNLPLPGGEVTLTWSVKGEESLFLSPFPGAVHGTGITLTISESTDFTLSARSGGRRDRETLHVGVGEPFAVSGKALRTSYGPASGFAVFVNGTTPAFTDAFGNFSLEGVVAPYDLVLIDPNQSNFLTVYSGLTRSDPTVVALAGMTPFTTNISGTVSGVPFPKPTPPPTIVDRINFFTPTGYRISSTPSAATGAFNINVYWASNESTPVSITTLRWVTGIDGLPASFPGYARTKTSMVDGVPLVLNPVLAPVPATSLSGSVTLDPGLDPTVNVFATVDYGSGAVQPVSGPSIYSLLDAVDLQGGAVGTSNTFTRFAPDVEASYALTASASGFGGSMAVTRRRLAAGASGVTIALPPQPRLLLPVNNAVVDSSTKFSIASADDMVNAYFFYMDGPTDFYAYILTDETSIGFPDLSAIGVSPDAIFGGYFHAFTYGPFDSVDELAGGTAFIPPGDETYSGYAFCCRNFTGPGAP